MRCDRFREAASARLDGEPPGLPAAALDRHLSTCTDCARWVDEAARLTRLARLGPVEVPDGAAFAGTITADVARPARRARRFRLAVRVGLLLVALVQVGIAVPELTGTGVGMAMHVHAAHEGGAFNLAIGIALGLCVLRPRRASGLIVVLASFLVVLAVLSVQDLAAGLVPIARLATHLAALAGLLLVVALERAERALPQHSPPGDVAADPEAGPVRSARRRLEGAA